MSAKVASSLQRGEMTSHLLSFIKKLTQQSIRPDCEGESWSK